MADANITKAVDLLRQNEREAIENPDFRLGFRAAEGAIELLPSYNGAGGDLNVMDMPVAVIPMPAGGTLQDFVNTVIYSAELGHAVAV